VIKTSVPRAAFSRREAEKGLQIPVAGFRSTSLAVLVLRPVEFVPYLRRCVAESPASLAPREGPIDSGALLVGLAIPNVGFLSKQSQVGEPAGPKAFARIQTELDLRLIEPASVFGRVVYGESIPQVAPSFFTE